MTLFRLLTYTGLLLGMLLPVLWMAVVDPQPFNLLLAAVFVLLIAPLIRAAVRLYRTTPHD